ncbi:hypothetical protein EDB86DRAFT_2835030 [Lactarius hatsudake]|nr:hypothetical protein EDB86DRAFT_2835030 [Lactarius hatsudake]
MAMQRMRAISHKLQVGIGRPASGDLDPLRSEGIGNVSGPEHPHHCNLRSTGHHHTHNSNPSEADDEEDDAESTLDEEVDDEHTQVTVTITHKNSPAAYQAAHYATITTFLGHVKWGGLQSGDGGYPFIALFGSVTDFGHRVGT